MIVHIFSGAAREGGNFNFVAILGHFMGLKVFQYEVTSYDGCTRGINMFVICGLIVRLDFRRSLDSGLVARTLFLNIIVAGN